MRTKLLLLLLAAPLAACRSSAPRAAETQPNAWVVDAYRKATLERAIVVQRTIYAYHFEAGRAELNPLGERDLAVLAAHFRTAPGDLAVRRGGVGDELYQARLAAVRDGLMQAGVDLERVALADAAPGGDGMSSERVHTILKRPETPLGGISTTGDGGGAAGAGAGAATGGTP